MYSLVLMTAVAAGSQTADFGWRRGCHGCHRAAHTCHACYGCYGCHGCYGGGYGCYGCYRGHGGHFMGCQACYGPALPYACYGYRLNHTYQCHGCYGCYGCYALPGNSTYNPSASYVSPYLPPQRVIQQPVQQPPIKKTDTPPVKKFPAPKLKDKKSDINFQNRATVVLEVPADAIVYVDGVRMKSSSARRTFVTPRLESGKTYYYDVRAEVVRNGQTVATNQRVFLRVGQNLPLSFANLGGPKGHAIAQGK